MNFATLDFWVLLIGGILLALSGRIIFSKKLTSENKKSLYDKTSLIIIGVTMLFYESFVSGVIFIIVTLLSYFSVLFLSRFNQKQSKKILFFVIPSILLPLIYYKYSYFFANQIFQINSNIFNDLIIPIGISFYTFQKVAFVIDTVARREPVPKFINFINFAGFFPQIVAGPIERKKDLLPQIESFQYKLNYQNIELGIRYIIVGLFFKLAIADNVAMLFRGGNTTSAWEIWMDNILFGLRIYFDFAGYGIIAVGISRCLNVRLTMNFMSPYTAVNANEFWRRWHISLTTWFRDYIYINLGGNRTKFWFINIFIVFIISGLWHGASWNFIIWGWLCGASLVISKFYSKLKIRIYPFVSWLLTMISCFYIWMFFYETNVKSLYHKSIILFNPNSYSLFNFSFSPQILIYLFSLSIAIITIYLEWLSNKKYKSPYHLLLNPISCCLMIFILIFFTPKASNEFIYFSF